MNLEWVVTGIILLGGMLAGGISLYVKRKRESQMVFNSFGQVENSDVTDFEEKARRG